MQKTNDTQYSDLIHGTWHCKYFLGIFLDFGNVFYFGFA